MIESIRNMFSVPDLRKRLLYTFGILAIYRLGSMVPVPGINYIALMEFFEKQAGNVLGVVNLFSGGSLSRAGVLGLGIMPYISASIMFQLLGVVWPYMEKLQKEGGAEGRKKINQWTRYATLGIALIQSFGVVIFLRSINLQMNGNLILDQGMGFTILVVLLMTTGCCFVMWLGEQITARGIGNGISLLIFASIVVGLIPACIDTYSKLQNGDIGVLTIAFLVLFMVIVVAAVVHVERAQRKIPIQYARRVVGQRMMGGQGTFFPLKLNPGGVMPVIFASSILLIPTTILGITKFDNVAWLQPLRDAFGYDGGLLYILMYLIAILFFCYFYTSIILNPKDMADNLKKVGGFIPGIRPGRKTSDYIDSILSKLVFAGAIYLALIAIVPVILLSGIKLGQLPWIGGNIDAMLTSLHLKWVTTGLGLNFYFGGTSLLIVVGVAMDFVQQIESQLVMRHYDGFMSRTRTRRRG